MRYVEIANLPQTTDRTAMCSLMDGIRAAHAARIWPEIGNPTADQQANMQHVVECPGLTVHDLGQAFAEEFQRRRLWCRENCQHEFAVEPIWDRAKRRDMGRRFLFASQADRETFRLIWS